MIAVLLSSLLLLFFFLTFGFYLTNVFKLSPTFFEKILLGLVVSNTLTTYLSLFFPINGFVLLLFIFFCSFFAVRLRNEFKKLFYRRHEKKDMLFCSFIFILIAFFVSLSPPLNYDTYLYHWQSIKWIEEFPVVPGLANLHDRFGFNPNIFTLFALTSLHGLFKQEIFSINFTVFSVLVIYFVNKLYSLLKHQGFTHVVVFNLCVFFAILELNRGLSCPTPDFLATTITLFIFTRIVDLSGQKETLAFKKYIPALILSIYVFTIKLAVLPIALLFIFFVIRYKSELRKSLWLLPVLSLVILPWLIRNVILTGWLLFPFPSIDLFGFDWKVPLAKVVESKGVIRAFARNWGHCSPTDMDLFSSSWFPFWWQRLSTCDRLYFIFSLLFPLLAFAGQLIRKLKINFSANAVIITSFLGVVYWFCMSPDFRFGKSFIVIASISPFLYLKFCWFPANKIKIIFIAIMTGLIGFFILDNYYFVKTNVYQILYSNRIMVPEKYDVFTGQDSNSRSENFTTFRVSGMDIFVPVKGNCCSDYTIPCTPYPDSNLVLRGKTLASGFKFKSESNNHPPGIE